MYFVICLSYQKYFKRVLVLHEIKMQSTLAIQRVMSLKNPINGEMMI